MEIYRIQYTKGVILRNTIHCSKGKNRKTVDLEKKIWQLSYAQLKPELHLLCEAEYKQTGEKKRLLLDIFF